MQVPRAGGVLRAAANLAENEVAYRARRRAIRPDVVLLESFAGNGALCNPHAIAQALLAAEDLRHLTLVWALSGAAWRDRAEKPYAGNPRVGFVRRRSPGYYRELGSAGFLVNNATFPQAFAKRPGQTYVNTWHGTPLKAMGYDESGSAGRLGAANIVRNLLCADYLLAPNETTESMYLDSYRMRGIGRAALLRIGTPRMDVQFAGPETRERTRQRLRDGGVELGEGGSRIVLFAPTWRGDFDRPDDDADRVARDAAALAAGLPSDTRVVVKVHQRTYDAARRDGRLRGRLVANSVPTNDVLAVSDALVSDYSSIMVDFVATGRPIVALVADRTAYARDRGLSDAMSRIPATECTSAQDAAAALTASLAHAKPDEDDRYRAARATFCPHEDGHAAERLVDVVFRRGAPEHGGWAPARPRLLINIGGLQPNGVSSAALALVNRLDHARVDVSVTCLAPRDEQARELTERIDPRVRLLPRLGGTTVTRALGTPLPVVGGRLPGLARRAASRPRIVDESIRCYGGTSFDSIVDFGGYSAFVARLLAATTLTPAGTRATWLHNDITTEMHSRDRSPWLRANLRRTTKLYRLSDRLVSVSPGLASLNAALIAARGRGAGAEVARNVVDGDRIRRLAREPLAQQWAHLADDDRWTFVTVGRLAEQKNQLRMLQAFATVHTRVPHTRLVLVGDGPMRDRLQDEAARLGLDGSVVFTGRLANPFAVLALGDCFVMSSDYEGQPVALLEALVLGLPVVTTKFASVADALPGGAAVVVDPDPDELARGMQRVFDGEMVAVPFDDAAYDELALAEFYRAVGIG